MKMGYNNAFFLLLLIVSNNLIAKVADHARINPSSIASITTQEVRKRSKKIKSIFFRKNLARSLAVTLASVYAGYQLCSSLNSLMTKSDKKEEKQSLAEGVAQSLSDTFSWKTLKNIPQSIALSGASFVFSAAFGMGVMYLYRRHIAPDTLMWFMEDQAPYRSVLLEIEVQLAGADQSAILSTDLYHSRVLVMAYSEMVNRITSILGFMHAKSCCFGKKRRHESNVVIKHVMSLVNRCTDSLKEAYASADVPYAKIYSLISNLHRNLDADFMTFARIEGSEWVSEAEFRYVAQLLGERSVYAWAQDGCDIDIGER